jgi:hypothetical protein
VPPVILAPLAGPVGEVVLLQPAAVKASATAAALAARVHFIW